MTNRPAAAQRLADLARIHILKKEAGLDKKDEDYRVLVATAGQGVLSSAELDDEGRRRLINMLEARKAKPEAPAPRPHNADVDTRKELRKVEALLTDAGRPWRYAVSILRRQTRNKFVRMEFAGPDELRGVIAALEKDALRRLVAELHKELQAQGLLWAHGKWYAVQMGMAPTRDLERCTQGLSEVLRFLRGQYAPFCLWPQ